jgi:hypothetical protein
VGGGGGGGGGAAAPQPRTPMLCMSGVSVRYIFCDL